MNKIILSLGLCILLFALSGCLSSQAPSQDDLTGNFWALSEIAGNAPVEGTDISIQFTSDGKVSGSSGCNQYSGTYTVSGSSITIASPLATTRMACEEAVMLQETAYLKALGEVRTYAVKTGQLSFTGGANTVILTYKAVKQDLAGTSWEATGYNNGKQAVTSVLAGTTLTAEFGADGNLAGNAGCNTYSGPYKVTRNQITIGPLASTKKACADPEGVMDQEMQYLAALQTAATYQVEGDVLKLRAQDGALAAQFQKK